jgi:hypothetical protein
MLEFSWNRWKSNDGNQATDQNGAARKGDERSAAPGNRLTSKIASLGFSLTSGCRRRVDFLTRGAGHAAALPGRRNRLAAGLIGIPRATGCREPASNREAGSQGCGDQSSMTH